MNLREIVIGQDESAGDVYLVVDFLQYELKEIQSGAQFKCQLCLYNATPALPPSNLRGLGNNILQVDDISSMKTEVLDTTITQLSKWVL